MNRRNFVLSSLASISAASSQSPSPTRSPNVILINCDDLGYGDLSCYGSPIATPNLDRMAAEGIRFTQCTSANPVCSPSRAGLLTGRYPTRVGVPRVLFPYDNTGLPASETTIAGMLRPAGYKSMCVGKWHLGHLPEFLPTSRGFDGYFGIPYSNDMNPPVLMRDTEVVEQKADMTRITGQYTQEALRFIESHQRQPFFLYLAHTLPHIPLGASARFRGKSGFGLYGDVVQELDWSTGEILRTLQRLQLDANTLVMFTSDNGPWFQGSPGRLRGRKGMVWDGGVRVPLIARWPRYIRRNQQCSQLVSTLDLMPTIARLTASTPPPQPFDGMDISPLLNGGKIATERDVLLYFDGWNVQAARLGKWKLHLARYNTVTYSPNPPGGRFSALLNQPELYDMNRDADESYDVAEEHPDIVDSIRKRVDALIPGFPEEVRKAWAAQSRPNTERRTGALPAAPKP